MFVLTPSQKRFAKFFIVGTLAYGVDVGVLRLMQYGLGLDPYTGRLVSFLCAASFSFAGNRFFTFRDRRQGHAGKQWMAFLLVSTGGFAINYGIYALLVSLFPWLYLHPEPAVAVGCLGGMFFNFSGASKLVFPSLEKNGDRAI